MSEANKIFIRAAAESNVGNARGNNEDNVYFNGDFITPRNISRPFAIKTGEYTDVNIFAVFDGMGRNNTGSFASLVAATELDSLADRISFDPDVTPDDAVLEYMQKTNEMIRDQRRETGGVRTASTMALLIIENGLFHIQLFEKVAALSADGVAGKHHLVGELLHGVPSENHEVENVLLAVAELHLLRLPDDQLPQRPVMFKALLRKSVFLQKGIGGRPSDDQQDGSQRDDRAPGENRQQMIEEIGGRPRGDDAGVSEYRIEHGVLSVHGEGYDEDVDKHRKAGLPRKAADQKDSLLGAGKIGEQEHDGGKRHEAHPVDVQRRDVVESHEDRDDDGGGNIGNIGVKTIHTEERNIHFHSQRGDSSQTEIIDARQREKKRIGAGNILQEYFMRGFRITDDGHLFL